MKKIKILFWLIVVIFFGLVVYSNLNFFATEHSFLVDLYKFKYHLPPVMLGVVLLGCFLAGFLICGLFNLKGRFRAGKEIKQLKEVISKSERTIATLRNGGAVVQDKPEETAPPASDEATATKQ